MGVSDRDYMRRAPDEKAVDEYEKQARESEYGAGTGYGARRLLVVIVIVVAVALLALSRLL